LGSRWSALRERMLRPVDAAWLVALRVLYGTIVFGSTARVLVLGVLPSSGSRDWVEAFFVRQRFHFKYYGFSWVEPPAGNGIYILLVALCLLGLLVAAGALYRVTSVALALGFIWFELIDATFYVNHYYLLSLLGLLLAISPAGRYGSLDAWWARRRAAPARPRQVAGAWLFLFRFQIGVVYTFAGLAKAHADWLVHAQPLRTWLAAKTDLPLLGPLLLQPWAAPAMSWAGFLFDIAIPWLLLLRRARPWAYGAVIGFHALTYLLFPRITMFPVIMIACALVFFPPDWPRSLFVKLLGRAPHPTAGVAQPPARSAAGLAESAALVALGLYCLVQVLVPLRCLAYGGDVRWHEQGLRFSWRVLHREKLGVVTFLVRDPLGERQWQIDPELYLNPTQATEMAEQPDLILQLAHHIRDDFAQRGLGRVEVRAHALATLNGRRSAWLIDPNVDLTAVDDSLAPARWIMPVPAGPPPHNRATR
jgi:vitamin K-dependent gamma-carboxylase